ncbi:hypothetical protein KGF54_000217 [Candida jiufengensis]|uniref:uncharacterized protein n=1 Tax=Candida jiufengensis TaxID=497108 RepID=UPI0022259EF6|nr:uncharacterized protein KGF54_000217 [Candida jiufengensis]KAI5957289.1 hypothetical protein KGF54_000217 [Candida jiufengensis]
MTTNNNIENVINELRIISQTSSNKFMIITQESLPNSTLNFYNSVHFKEDQIEEIKLILGRATLTTIKPTLKQMYALKLNKRHPNSTILINQYKDLFNSLSQVVCKEVAKQWIKIVEPSKQALYPYRDFNNSKPSWWPRNVDHIEPDHLDKFGRVDVLINILRYPSFDLRKISLKNAIFESRPAIQLILQEILYLAIYERCFFNEYRNQDELFELIPQHEKSYFDNETVMIMTSNLRFCNDELLMVRNMDQTNLNDYIFGLNEVKNNANKIKPSKKFNQKSTTSKKPSKSNRLSGTSKVAKPSKKKSSKKVLSDAVEVKIREDQPEEIKKEIKSLATSRAGQLLEDHELIKSLKSRQKIEINELINKEEDDDKENEQAQQQQQQQQHHQQHQQVNKIRSSPYFSSDDALSVFKIKIQQANNNKEVAYDENDEIDLEPIHLSLDPDELEEDEEDKMEIEQGEEGTKANNTEPNKGDVEVTEDDNNSASNDKEYISNIKFERPISSYLRPLRSRTRELTPYNEPVDEHSMYEVKEEEEEDTQVDSFNHADNDNCARLTAYGSYMFVEEDANRKFTTKSDGGSTSSDDYDDEFSSDKLEYAENYYSIYEKNQKIKLENTDQQLKDLKLDKMNMSTPNSSVVEEESSQIIQDQFQTAESHFSSAELYYDQIINQSGCQDYVSNSQIYTNQGEDAELIVNDFNITNTTTINNSYIMSNDGLYSNDTTGLDNENVFDKNFYENKNLDNLEQII